MVCNCRFYIEINNAIILIVNHKAPIKIKVRARHIMPIRMRYAVTNGGPTPPRCKRGGADTIVIIKRITDILWSRQVMSGKWIEKLAGIRAVLNYLYKRLAVVRFLFFIERLLFNYLPFLNSSIDSIPIFFKIFEWELLIFFCHTN